MKRWGVVGLVAIAALVVSLLAVPGASAAPRAEGAATVQVNINPVDRSGHLKPDYHVVYTLFGANCYTSSDLFPGTYRCILGHSILDPCWPRIDARGGYHGSYCLRLPWLHDGIVIRGRHVHLRHEKGRRLWGLHTTDGYGCSTSAGAHDVFHGQPVLWRCASGARWLLAMPDRSTAQWQITEVTYSSGHFHDPHRVGITKAWYAVSPFGRG
jgi:hypothetical protein